MVDAETDRFGYVNPADWCLLEASLEEVLASRSVLPDAVADGPDGNSTV